MRFVRAKKHVCLFQNYAPSAGHIESPNKIVERKSWESFYRFWGILPFPIVFHKITGTGDGSHLYTTYHHVLTVDARAKWSTWLKYDPWQSFLGNLELVSRVLFFTWAGLWNKGGEKLLELWHGYYYINRVTEIVWQYIEKEIKQMSWERSWDGNMWWCTISCFIPALDYSSTFVFDVNEILMPP